jgi:hypothetical protein
MSTCARKRASLPDWRASRSAASDPCSAATARFAFSSLSLDVFIGRAHLRQVALEHRDASAVLPVSPFAHS